MNKYLETYRRKRDFKQTPEPSGKTQIKRGNSYLIQKHVASHLHYDFRLELDGVLKSWAVPKGPSYDPADKRLAMQVEDHPVEYGTFEGMIPKGQYGGGTVMLWDTGTWEPIGDARKGLADGKIVFQLHGKRLKGEWTLVRTFSKDKKGNKWLLIKHKDEFVQIGNNTAFLEKNTTSVISRRTMEKIAAAPGKVWGSKSDEVKDRAGTRPLKTKNFLTHAVSLKTEKLPRFLPPQLATLATFMPMGKEWVHEIKFDGYRMIAHIQNGNVTMFSRNGNIWTDKFDSIAELLSKFKIDNAVLDGEVVVQDQEGRSNFSALKTALTNKDTEFFQYYIFDILFLNGENLTNLSLVERKGILEELLKKNKNRYNEKRIIYSEHFINQTEKFLQSACSLHLEGIVSKRADAPYFSGRTKVWLKIKCHMRQEFVIGGFTLPSKNGPGLGSLLLGFYDQGKLIYAGRVGTGFTFESATKIRKTLEKLKTKTMPYVSVPTEGKRGANWVKPKLVGEIEFSEWTPDSHLRHPSFQGLREDKKASAIVKEVPIPIKSAILEAEKEVESDNVGLTPMRKAKFKNEKALTTKNSSKTSAEKINVGGITISHASRLIYPVQNITKGELAEYYLSVADYILPYIQDRPLSVLRCPQGTAEACFFQRHVGLGQSPHVHEVSVTVKDETRKYISIHDKKGLLSLVQWGAIEFHPWECTIKDLNHPDRMVFDLDPDPAVSWKELIAGAFDVRTRLKQIGFESFLKTTGGKGLHVVVPLTPIYEWDIVKSFARGVAETMANENPKNYIATMSKAARKGKIFIDYLRNDVTSTAVAPFSARARDGATVSTPLYWKELTPDFSRSDMTIRTVVERLKKLKKDPWQDFSKMRQRLPKKLLEALKTRS